MYVILLILWNLSFPRQFFVWTTFVMWCLRIGSQWTSSGGSSGRCLRVLLSSLLRCGPKRMSKHMDCARFCGWKHLSSWFNTLESIQNLISTKVVWRLLARWAFRRCCGRDGISHAFIRSSEMTSNLRRHAHFSHYHCIESRLMHMLADIVTEGRNICNNSYVHQITNWEVWTLRNFNSIARKIDYQSPVFEILSFLEVQIRVKTATIFILIRMQTQQKSFTSNLYPNSQLRITSLTRLRRSAWPNFSSPWLSIVNSDLVIWTNSLMIWQSHKPIWAGATEDSETDPAS